MTLAKGSSLRAHVRIVIDWRFATAIACGVIAWLLMR